MLFKRFGKRLLAMVLVIMTIAALGLTAIAADPQEPTADAAYSCRIHHSASPSSAVIGQMEDGKQLTVLGETKKFYRISCYEMNGYIAKEQVQERGGVYYVNCKKDHRDTTAPRYVSLSDVLQLRKSLLDVGSQYLGRPYVYGGMSPSGFDCSGFTSYIYKRHSHILTRRADQQLQDGLVIPRESLQYGDLLFFRAGGSSALATHVGIYAGNNLMLHSASGGLQYTNLDMDYYANSYIGARRVFNIRTNGIELAPSAAQELIPSARMGQGMRTGLGMRTAG